MAFYSYQVYNRLVMHLKNNMLNEIKVEIGKLIQDLTFVRNLSLTSIVAIAFFCNLSELPSTKISRTEEALIASLACGNGISHMDMTKIIIEN
jgi:hypothetical protein